MLTRTSEGEKNATEVSYIALVFFPILLAFSSFWRGDTVLLGVRDSMLIRERKSMKEEGMEAKNGKYFTDNVLGELLK